MFVRKMTGSEQPQQISYDIKLGLRRYVIAFDIKEADNGYEWTEAVFALGTPDYGAMVSAFVHGRYSDDEMQAIVNNHLLDDGDEEHEAEWTAMQAWRAEAKVLAKTIGEELEPDGSEIAE